MSHEPYGGLKYPVVEPNFSLILRSPSQISFFCFSKESPFSAMWRAVCVAMSLRDPKLENQLANVPILVGNMKLVTGHCNRSNSVAASAGLSAPSSIVKKTTLSVVSILYSTLAWGSSVAESECELSEITDPRTIEAMKTRRIMNDTLGHRAKMSFNGNKVKRKKKHKSACT